MALKISARADNHWPWLRNNSAQSIPTDPKKCLDFIHGRPRPLDALSEMTTPPIKTMNPLPRWVSLARGSLGRLPGINSNASPDGRNGMAVHRDRCLADAFYVNCRSRTDSWKCRCSPGNDCEQLSSASCDDSDCLAPQRLRLTEAVVGREISGSSSTWVTKELKAYQETTMGTKGQQITGWIMSVILVLFLAGPSALGKFLEWEGKAKMFEHIGFTIDLIKQIGILEVVIALLFLIPQTAFVAAILLTGYLGGAVVTHLRVGDPFFMPILVGVFLWVALALRRPEIWYLASGRPLNQSRDPLSGR